MLPIAQCMVILALGTSIRAQSEKVDVEAVRKKYAASCQPSSTSEPCKQMRSQIEYALYTDLLLSMGDGEAPPPSAIEVGLKAESPQLRTLANGCLELLVVRHSRRMLTATFFVRCDIAR